MKGKEDDKTRVLSIVALLLCFILLETNAMAANKIVLQKYPGVKLGLLNVNFMKQWPLGLESAKKTIDYASEQGYWWIEVRDPLASLTLTQAKELAAYAEQKGIEIAYAMAVGFLDHNFWEVFSRGLASSAVFKGPRVVRTAGPGLEFATDPKKTHWTFGELQRAVKTANRAADFAKMFGLQYVVENGGEAFKGNGASTFGTSELFANANSNLGLQSDTGNFFVQRVWTKPEEAQAFIEKYADRVGYIHLKTSSKDHKPQPVAGDNELDHDIVFAIAAKAKMPYIGFELAQPDTLEQVYKNHKKSVEYLKRRFGG